MALNPRRIRFFFEQLQKSNYNSIVGVTAQLFEHLRSEVKDNPIYVQYEEEKFKWNTWIEQFISSFNRWEMPQSFDDAKKVAYTLYSNISNPAEDATNIIFEVTGEENFNQGIREFNQMLLEYFELALQDIINANPETEEGKIEKVKGDRVFIIHGHDDHLKTQLQLLLTRAGVNNIVLHEQPDRGRTIIDKLIDEGEVSNYAIAILSPDDMVNDGKLRARQNVILEIGYFLGRLGKERVRMLIKDDIEIPSDLSGILYEKYDSNGFWKMRLLKELMEVGIFVDVSTVAKSL